MDRNIRAALDMIKEGMIVGLGAGSDAAALARAIHETGLEVSVTTPSMQTKRICRELGIKIIDPRFLSHVDIVFDNCDEVDEQFRAIKSNSGIHTRAKIIASMADLYVLFADDLKYGRKLKFRHPICLEVLKPALSSVIDTMKKEYGPVIVRENPGHGNLQLSEDGNYLVDVRMKAPADLEALARRLDSLTGVVEHSIFTDQADRIILARAKDVWILHKNGSWQVYEEALPVSEAGLATDAGNDDGSHKAKTTV